ncbi:MAG TPA: hypothetical protein VIK48_03520, partial [Candidatus Manganitrophaceae bacterium]
RADPLVGEDFEEEGVGDPAVDDVRLPDPFLDQPLDLFSGKGGNELSFFIEGAGDIGEFSDPFLFRSQMFIQRDGSSSESHRVLIYKATA